VAAHEHGLGAGGAKLLGCFLGGAVVAHVPDRDALLAGPREAERDGLSDPACAPGDEDRHARRGSGESAGAELGSSSQPGRSRDSRPPSSAFEEAWPSRSSSSIFRSPYARTSSPSGSCSISSRMRARSWYAKCGVAGATRRSISSLVGAGIAPEPYPRRLGALTQSALERVELRLLLAQERRPVLRLRVRLEVRLASRDHRPDERAELIL